MVSVVLRFVVLHHTGVAEPHFDLMLEEAPVGLLRTWRSPTWPIVSPTPLVALPAHRRIYLDYEGAISGDRGVVRQVEKGTHQSWPPGDHPHVFELRLDKPVLHHLRLFRSPGHAWLIEPAP